MAALPIFNNVSTIVGEDGIERVTDFQFIESSFVMAPPIETPPGSICPVCGNANIDMSDGHMHCHECGTEANLGINVETTSMVELLALIEDIPSNSSNPCGEIKKKINTIKRYEDIVGDIRYRFEILDL
jgi:hypothetical protein